eukprot:2901671-Ditylum_brightwellii.AAC.1
MAINEYHSFKNTTTPILQAHPLQQEGHHLSVDTLYNPWVLAAGDYEPNCTMVNIFCQVNATPSIAATDVIIPS